MRVRRLTHWDDVHSLQHRWNQLAAGVPFCQWEWLATWWRHFSTRGELYLLVVENDLGETVGIAPLFVEELPLSGRTLQFLGSGKACSDYLAILTESSCSGEAVETLAEWLVSANQQQSEDGWDILCVDGADSADLTLEKLLAGLERRGCRLYRQAGESCWRIPLPRSWEGYLEQLPKPQRKHMRQAQSRLEASQGFQILVPNDVATRDYVWDRFVELHQRRRNSLGQPGCFANAPFAAFLRETIEAFWKRGRLQLLLVQQSGIPVGSLLSFSGSGISYAYQMGTNPDFLAASPGWLVVGAAVRASIERRDSALDLLRGNESYKSRMGAVPHEMQQVRVIPPRLGAQLRHRVWQTGTTVKSWIKSGILSTGLDPSAVTPYCPI